MTKNKAIEIISYHKALIDRDKSGLLDKNLEYEAIDMAIKALEPYEDCVSRKDVINYIRTLACDLSYWSVTDEVVKDIEALPSTTPTQKKGKWENGNPICPCCGEEKFKDLDANIWADWQPKYCPNCGAEMRGN